MVNFLAQSTKYLLGKFLSKRNLYITNSLNEHYEALHVDPNYLDYIRLATLKLLANEINTNKISGAVAELGVYKGKYARYINEAFPDRDFYLFDTFEGFDKRDVKVEQEKKFGAADQNFSNTSIQEVMGRMQYPQKCIIKKGYFPQTAEGVTEQFAFVSLDTDLYEPILNGLSFFYDKLAKGGYIMVHDYNNKKYTGAKKAVTEFCTAKGIPLTPIPDAYGSVVIGK